MNAMKTLPFLFLLAAIPLPAPAQPDATSSAADWQASAAALARGGPLARADYPGDSAASPAQLFEHGSLCLLAAQQARKLGSPARAQALLDEAKFALQGARQRLGGAPAALRGRIAYSLGQIEENAGHDLEAAEQDYAEAVQLMPKDRDAQQALARVQAYLAFRQSLN
jgi:hypothetical protein